MYPNDFELYIVALELVNSKGQVENYFLFPVQPFSNVEQNKPIQSIKKTMGGYTVMSTETFSSSNIQLQGNFGRKFKFLVNQQVLQFSAYTEPKPLIQNEFNSFLKTGYGCCKVLEAIIKKSNTLDDSGGAYQLFLYNLAFGNSYVVKAENFDFRQNLESNMIWNYTLSLKTLLPLSEVSNKPKGSLTTTLVGAQVIQNVAGSVTSFTGQVLFNVAKNDIPAAGQVLRNGVTAF